jgi:hypothetical protein
MPASATRGAAGVLRGQEVPVHVKQELCGGPAALGLPFVASPYTRILGREDFAIEL